MQFKKPPFISAEIANGNIPKTFIEDVIWNFFALIIFGLSGIAMYCIIGRLYGSTILGIFSLVLTIVIFVSHLGNLGMYFSVLKHISEKRHSIRAIRSSFTSAILITTVASFLATVLTVVFRYPIASIFDNNLIADGILYVSTGLFCFSLNRVFLGALNAMNRMRSYAVLTSFRYLSMIFFLILLCLMNAEGTQLVFSISISETLLLVLVIIIFFRKGYIAKPDLRDVKENLFFGMKAMPSGLFADIQPKIDILMLGIFTQESLVGIYTLAAMVADGLHQFILVFQMNINPTLTTLVENDHWETIRSYVLRAHIIVVPAAIVLSLIGYWVYPVFIEVLVGNDEFLKGQDFYLYISCGIAISSGYIGFGMLLNQSGKPAYHTLLLLFGVMTNLLLNSILIPVMGGHGAAISTCITFILSIFYLKLLIFKALGHRI